VNSAGRLLLGSVAVNLGLLAAFALKPALLPREVRVFFVRGSTSNTPLTARLDSEIRSLAALAEKQTAATAGFWSALDSNELPTLVRNLRAAGISPSIVRAIVTVRVNERADDRLNTLAASITDTPFWKPDPMDSASSSRYYDEVNRILEDRWQIVDQLVGDASVTSPGVDVIARQQRAYGNLPPHKIELLRQINSDYAEMAKKARAAAREIALPEDEEKSGMLERARRADIVALLTPAELQTYDLHTSTLTWRLREPLTFMNGTEEEFLTIYGIHQPFAETLYSPGTTDPAESASQQKEARRQIADQLRAALGDSRYADFVRASIPEFQQLSRIANRADVPPASVARAFDLRGAFADQSNRIFDDDSQTADQKRAALQALAQKIRAQLIDSLGPTVGTEYARLAGWIAQIERGNAVTLGADAKITSTRSLSPANPRPATSAR
jgi:hypothetical protein